VALVALVVIGPAHFRCSASVPISIGMGDHSQVEVMFALSWYMQLTAQVVAAWPFLCEYE